MKRLQLITTFLLFIALCVSVAYWGLQIYKPPPREIAAPPQTYRPPSLGAAASLFGGHATMAASNSFQLTGVVVASNPSESVAIISVNGKPAQAVGIDKAVIPGVNVKEVQKQFVLLLEGGTIRRIDMPPDPRHK